MKKYLGVVAFFLAVVLTFAIIDATPSSAARLTPASERQASSPAPTELVSEDARGAQARVALALIVPLIFIGARGTRRAG